METSKTAVFKLKLLVDKKREKVVLAEAGKDFVDVLFSFLTLPMGSIVRLLEKHQKSQATTIGCFNNLYKIVVHVGNDSFMTEACTEMLLYPRSVKEDQRRRLKLNIDDNDSLKYYWCSRLCRDGYTNFSSSRCRCGALMKKELETQLGQCEEIFVSDKSSFTIKDNMSVEHTSTGLTLKTLKDLGYTDVGQLHEMVVDVNHEKVLALLQCLFSSDTVLTDVFLLKRSSCNIIKALNLPLNVENGGEADSNKLMSVTVFTSKLDNKVLYIAVGCVDNLCKSFRELSYSEGRKALANKCTLPWYYSCEGLLLDVGYAKRDQNRPGTIDNFSLSC